MAHGGCRRRSRAQQRQPRLQRAGGGAEDGEGSSYGAHMCLGSLGRDAREFDALGHGIPAGLEMTCAWMRAVRMEL